MHKKSNWNVYVAVGISMIGMYFLSVTEDFSIAYGDALMMICAFMFAKKVYIIGYFQANFWDKYLYVIDRFNK